MINRFPATIESCDRRDGHAGLRVRGGRLVARLWPGAAEGAHVTVRIRPEDVLVAVDAPGRTSARNVLPGHVKRLRATGDGAVVTIDAGFPLDALVTRAAARDLRLRAGVAVFALVKATAVVVIAGARPHLRAAIDAPGGRLDVESLDLLRAVGRTGSLSAAARELGIAYRTAWLRLGAVSRAWGAPLASRARGGRGGGGAALTPVGRALVDAADEGEAVMARLRGF